MPERRCPDCLVELEPIALLDIAAHGQVTGISYTATDAKRSVWTGLYPVKGTVNGFMCLECGRVLLYAQVPKDLLPIPAAAGAESDASGLPRPSARDGDAP